MPCRNRKKIVQQKKFTIGQVILDTSELTTIIPTFLGTWLYVGGVILLKNSPQLPTSRMLSKHRTICMIKYLKNSISI